jgi:hypothetical protein
LLSPSALLLQPFGKFAVGMYHAQNVVLLFAGCVGVSDAHSPGG